MPCRLLLLLLPWLILNPAGAAPVSVVDDSGRTIRLDSPARRIVTLSPHATELVFAAGAGDRVVAVAPYSDFPAAARQLPSIGSLSGLDRERLLALAPDLVIAWDSGNRPADLAWLAQQDIAVYRSEPRKLQDIADNLRDIGQLTGTTPVAEQEASRYTRALTTACPAPPGPRLPTFIRLAERPLLTVGNGHWMDEAIRHAGLRNVYADLPGRALTVSHESLLAREAAVTLYLAYPGISAPGDGQGIALNPALWARPGPRLVAGIAQLCQALNNMPGANALRSKPLSQQAGSLINDR